MEVRSGRRRWTIPQTHDRPYNAKPGVVTGDSHHAQTFCPDGKNHHDKNVNGKRLQQKPAGNAPHRCPKRMEQCRE